MRLGRVSKTDAQFKELQTPALARLTDYLSLGKLTNWRSAQLGNYRWSCCAFRTQPIKPVGWAGFKKPNIYETIPTSTHVLNLRNHTGYRSPGNFYLLQKFVIPGWDLVRPSA